MATEMNSDPPPPSYAEATGINHGHPRNHNDRSDPVDVRRHTLTAMIIAPIYSHISNRNIDGPVFPQAFSLYCQSPQHYMIGEGYNSPLCAVSTHPLYTQPDMIIHKGTRRDSPPLATIDHQPFSRSASITLPARQGSRFPAAHELLESVGAFSRVMSFSIETTPSGRSREHFEWRHSSGGEVEALGGRHSGWKLVRVSTPPVSVLRPSSLYGPLKRKYSTSSGSNVLGQSSDGKEVVAVFSEVS